MIINFERNLGADCAIMNGTVIVATDYNPFLNEITEQIQISRIAEAWKRHKQLQLFNKNFCKA